jgi:protein gp37
VPVWLVETEEYLFRLDYLLSIPAKNKLVSFEPLLGDLGTVNAGGISWAIVGGESGPRSRPVEKAQVINIRNQRLDSGVPFFFKQWGGANKKKTGRLLEGKTWAGRPALTPYA